MKNSTINNIAKAVTYILLVLLVLGACGLVLYFVNAPKGIYLLRDGASIGDSGTTIEVGKDVEFFIGNSEDWGVYTVQDCMVTIVPNVDESHNFNFEVDGKSKSFDEVSDLSAAFFAGYNGSGILIGESGNFVISVNSVSVKDMLSVVYGKNISLDEDKSLADFPYVAIQLVAPNNTGVVVPVLVNESIVDDDQVPDDDQSGVSGLATSIEVKDTNISNKVNGSYLLDTSSSYFVAFDFKDAFGKNAAVDLAYECEGAGFLYVGDLVSSNATGTYVNTWSNIHGLYLKDYFDEFISNITLEDNTLSFNSGFLSISNYYEKQSVDNWGPVFTYTNKVIWDDKATSDVSEQLEYNKDIISSCQFRIRITDKNSGLSELLCFVFEDDVD